MLERKLVLACILIALFVSAACSGRLVKREELELLHKKYAGVYVIKEKVDIGNNNHLEKGAKVRIYFKSGSESVKVYAYRYNQPREQAIGKNILYLFEDEFPDEEYDRKLFEEKLGKLIEPTEQPRAKS